MADNLEDVLWMSGPDYGYGADGSGYYSDHRNHVLERDFDINDPSELEGATLTIAVLGSCRVFVNNEPADGGAPLGIWTNYTKRVYSFSLDVLPLLHEGRNTLRVELGNGWYNPSPLRLFGKYNLRERLAEVGTPRVALRLCAADSEQTPHTLVESDRSWSCREGQLLFNNIYLGERRDLSTPGGKVLPLVVRQESRDVKPCPSPRFVLGPRVTPSSVKQREDGSVFLDFGRIISGYFDLSMLASQGDVITLTFAEAMDKSGNLSCDSNLAGLVGMVTPEGLTITGGPDAPKRAMERDQIICAEGENRFVNEFTVHSFRYVLLEGAPASAIIQAAAIYMHADLKRVGSFECDNPDLQALYDAALATKLNNVRDTWEDCSRERFGYGGDMVALAISNLLTFDCEGLIAKVVGDFSRDQTERGGVPETAPYMGIQSNGTGAGEGPLLWQLAFPYLTLKSWQHYGSKNLLSEEWPALKRQADYLLSQDPASLSTRCLGDHGSVETGDSFKTGTPDKSLVGWCTILAFADCAARIAHALGKPEEERYRTTANSLRAQIVERFKNPDGSFGDGTQTGLAFAAAFELENPQRLADQLAAKVQEDGGVLATGIFGTTLAFEVLHRYDHDNVVESWLLRRTKPSLLDMLASGNGVLAEQFHTNLSSLNHAMFSSYVGWLMEAPGGIRVEQEAVSADSIQIKPYFAESCNHVRATLATKAGTVMVEWSRRGGSVELRASYPASAHVSVEVPAGYCALSRKATETSLALTCRRTRGAA
ncbi:MAG: family 78 glycoside hydrolase catalytic domain [Tractidigestivibacter sp.]|jgi:alpha-L-rhamnosidase|uniref:family 78 glycoside hydrolase catalytic domain n=1 Tax=Tractidigestivibacter sp. TaxID=2847320 RepID=UPI003D8B5822